MFGRTLQSFTSRNCNSVLRSRNLVNSISQPSQYVIKSQKINYYSTQSSNSSKPFTMVEKKIEEIRTPVKPTSPHLTIYNFPLPAIVSIMHRATGVTLALGLSGVCAAAIFAPQDVTVYIDMLKTNYPLLVYPAKFAIAFPLVYHTSTGLRHIIWDTTCKYLTIPQVDGSSKLILGFVAAASLFLTFYSM